MYQLFEFNGKWHLCQSLIDNSYIVQKYSSSIKTAIKVIKAIIKPMLAIELSSTFCNGVSNLRGRNYRKKKPDKSRPWESIIRNILGQRAQILRLSSNLHPIYDACQRIWAYRPRFTLIKLFLGVHCIGLLSINLILR